MARETSRKGPADRLSVVRGLAVDGWCLHPADSGERLLPISLEKRGVSGHGWGEEHGLQAARVGDVGFRTAGARRFVRDGLSGRARLPLGRVLSGHRLLRYRP